MASKTNKTVYTMSASTADQVRRLIGEKNANRPGREPTILGSRTVLVECISTTPASGNLTFASQCFLGRVLEPLAHSNGTPDSIGTCWITILGSEGVGAPVANGIYLGTMAGDLEISNLTRPRVFVGEGEARSVLKVTGPRSNGTYPALRQARFHAGNLAYTLGNQAARARGLNNETLSVDTYYAEAQQANGTTVAGNLTLYLVVAGTGNGTGNGGGGGTSDCGGFAGLSANSCVFATVNSGTGNCANVPSSSTGMENAGSVWNSPDPIDLGSAGNATLYFTPGNAATHGYPAAWFSGNITETWLTLANCDGGNLTFKGGMPICGNMGNGPGTVPCPPDQFSVTLTCDCCDPDYDGPGWYCVDDGEGGTECVELTSCPGGSLIISGPHEDEETCIEECDDIISSECCPGVEIPGTLYVHVTAAVGAYACYNGKTYQIDYDPMTGIWEWTGADACDPAATECGSFNISPLQFYCTELGEDEWGWELLSFDGNQFGSMTEDCEDVEFSVSGSVCNGPDPEGDGSYISFLVDTNP